jgi:glycosyltransferase involved in cell wall biosynthesis
VTSGPLVSVIIGAYNTADFIAGTISSILEQTYTSYEIFVVNDGSPDTPALEAALAPVRDRIHYFVQENRGISAARNVGIRASKGEYIALLDSDDAWEPDYLAVQVAAMEADPTLAVLYPDARIVGDHPHAGRTFMDVCPSKGKPTFRRVLNQECHVFISAIIRRDAIERVNLFDESLRSVEDFDLWLRILASGGRIDYHRRVLVRFRKRRGSLSADPVWMGQHVLHVLDQAARTLDLPPDDSAALDRRRRYFRAVLDLARGKRAFFRMDTAGALDHIERANVFFRSGRLRVVCVLIRTVPAILLGVYRVRDRLVVGADTSF